MGEVDTTNGTTEATNGSTEAPTDLEAKIIKQIEFYFGDTNLMKDKFLKEQIKEDDGWVSLEIMLKFNRLKQLSSDENVICTALKKSTAGLMEVHDGGDKIRRCPSKPLPEDSKERRDEMSSRMIYAKCFPLEATLDDLQTFFESYGPVEHIGMKRDFNKKTFKGSVFVTFCNKDDCAKFLKEDGTKYKDTDITRKLLKVDYFKEKSKKMKDDKPGKAGDADKRDNSEKRDNSKPQKEKITAENVEEHAKQQMTKNAVMHFSGLDPTTTREDLKGYFGKHSEIGWVDFDQGKTEGYIRFKEPNSAPLALEGAKKANDGKLTIKDKEFEVRVVEGDEELEYWKKMFLDIAEKGDQKRGGQNRRGGGRGRGRGFGGGRGGRGGYRNRDGHQGKRRNENDDFSRERKAAKVDAE